MMRCLIIFAKEPEKGKVKSRLAKEISEEKALDLYKAFVKDTLNLAKKVKSDKEVVAYSCSNSYSYLKKVGTDFCFHRQKGKSLGDRIIESLSFSQKKYFPCQTVIIGSDSPHLSVSLIRRSFAALKRVDVVLGPCEDGGFYLLGMKKIEPKIFKGVVWSSSSVLTKILLNIKKLGLKSELLETFFDIDKKIDLKKLKEFLKNKKNTASETQRILKKGDMNDC